MKLAIIGSGPIALEAALQFHALDAHLTWFNFETPNLREHLPGASWNHSTSEAGFSLLGKKPDANFTWPKWQQFYQKPLIEFLKSHEQQVRPHKVVSVAKRYLAPNEEVSGSSRFSDLFRIIYELNPQEFIDEQKISDPEVYARLSEEMLQSLQTSLEMYEDFDLVLDLREPNQANSVNVTGRALGEGRITSEKILFGLNTLRHYEPSPDLREICLVGSGELAAQVLLRLEEWLREERSRLFVVSHDPNPFANHSEVKKIIEAHEEEFRTHSLEFHQKLRDWQALDDFVQVKIPRPVEPIPRLVFFSGHNVSAIDQLIDKRRLFVTLEKPEFRTGLRQPENNFLDLKTIGVDLILGANDLVSAPIEMNLRHDEIGFFKHNCVEWNQGLNALEGIKNEIFKLFSPASSAH